MKAKSLADAHYRPATAFSGCCRDCKNFFRTGNVEGEVRRDIYGKSDNSLRPVGGKPVLPREEEIALNTRARSAKLRVAEKTADGKRRQS